MRSARKHMRVREALPGGAAFRDRMNAIEDSGQQLAAVAAFFQELGARVDRLPAAVPAEQAVEFVENDA